MRYTPRRAAIGPLLLTLGLGVAFPASALQTLAIPDNGTGIAKISAKEVNRVAVQNGRIRKIFGADGALQIDIDDEKGEVYLRPLDQRTVMRDGARVAAPVNVFITDNQGRTYTLVLETADIPAETILINGTGAAPQRGKTGGARTVLGRDSSYKEAITEAVRVVANREVPDGYTERRVNETVPLWKESNFVLKATYTGEGVRIEHYVLTNTSGTEMRLHESEFARSGVLAVGIENAVLRNNGKTNLYIVREVDRE